MDVTLRDEQPEDFEAVAAIHLDAFGQPQEGQLVAALRANGAVLVSLVAVVGTRVVGHILYTPVSLAPDSPEPAARDLVGAGLAPVAVLRGFQRLGIGKKLVEEGNRRLAKSDCPFIVVLGHPEYYPKFGFEPASRHGLRCEWEVPDEVFMVRVFDPTRLQGLSGLVKYRDEFSSVT